MDNVIRLEFEKSLSGLAGYDFGLAVYYEQIEKKVNLEGKNILVFPDNVQRVASSFTQGLFAEIVKKNRIWWCWEENRNTGKNQRISI